MESMPKWAENSGFLIPTLWKYTVPYKERYFSSLDVFTVSWGFYLSGHTVKHWKCWAWKGIAVYHCSLLSVCLSFTGQKGTEWNCRREFLWGRTGKGMGRRSQWTAGRAAEITQSTTTMTRTNWTVGGSVVCGKSLELASIQENWISVSVLLITCCITLDKTLYLFRPWFRHQYRDKSSAHLAYITDMTCD